MVLRGGIIATWFCVVASLNAFAQPAPVGPGETPGLKLDVPYGPTGLSVTHTMLQVAQVSARDFVIDLGSGDGRINIIAARDYGARGEGYDLDPVLVKASDEFARIAKVSDRVKFFTRNLFEADLSRASVITLYVGPVVTPKVAPKLLAELKPGTRIVSHNFTMGDWKPDLTVTGRENASRVHFWWAPARVAGSWRAVVTLPDVGARRYLFELSQRYQEVEGEAQASAEPNLQIIMRDVRLEGTRISFLLQERKGEAFVFRRFVGEVRGEQMVGHFREETPPREVPVTIERSVRMEPGPPGAWDFAR
jgi:Ribosomal protein L11 methyltransferase (PrmA)